MRPAESRAEQSGATSRAETKLSGTTSSRARATSSRAEQSKATSRAEWSRAEQSRAEQRSRTTSSRAEQSRAEQSRAEQSRAEQSRLTRAGQGRLTRAEQSNEPAQSQNKTTTSRAEQRAEQSDKTQAVVISRSSRSWRAAGGELSQRTHPCITPIAPGFTPRIHNHHTARHLAAILPRTNSAPTVRTLTRHASLPAANSRHASRRLPKTPTPLRPQTPTPLRPKTPTPLRPQSSHATQPANSHATPHANSPHFTPRTLPNSRPRRSRTSRLSSPARCGTTPPWTISDSLAGHSFSARRAALVRPPPSSCPRVAWTSSACISIAAARCPTWSASRKRSPRTAARRVSTT